MLNEMFLVKGSEAQVIIQRNWKELIKPDKLAVESNVDSARTATVVAEPLERGFGLTL